MGLHLIEDEQMRGEALAYAHAAAYGDADLADAIADAAASGRPIAEVAREHGVARSTLRDAYRRWREGLADYLRRSGRTPPGAAA